MFLFKERGISIIIIITVAFTPVDEMAPSIPNQDYDDYWREFQTIQEESPTENGQEEEKEGCIDISNEGISQQSN